MSLETGTYINDLVTSNPAATDLEAQGDDHLRLLKSVLKATFPSADKATYVQQPQADVASATTTDLGAATSDYVRITGTTTITAFGTVAAGVRRIVRFEGALVLTHNGTSLILPGAASITTAANDRLEAISLGSGNWLVMWFERASGVPVRQFPATTAMLFMQTAAPTGWTKGSARNDYALRLVSGTVGNGGTHGFAATIFTDRTITQAMLPNYNLNIGSLSLNITNGSNLVAGTISGYSAAPTGTDVLRVGGLSNVGLSGGLSGTLPSGGSGAGFPMGVLYQDVIYATQD